MSELHAHSCSVVVIRGGMLEFPAPVITDVMELCMISHLKLDLEDDSVVRELGLFATKSSVRR